jgi:hypothetical protein
MGKHPELEHEFAEHPNVAAHPAGAVFAFEVNTNVRAPVELVAVIVQGVLVPLKIPIKGADAEVPS